MLRSLPRKSLFAMSGLSLALIGMPTLGGDVREDQTNVAQEPVAAAVVLPAIPAYEVPPVLAARDLLAQEFLEGADFRVEDRVPTDGFLMRFKIHSSFGSFDAASPQMVEIRIAEIRALRELEEFDTNDLAADGFRHSAKEFGDNLGHLIAEPEETLKGIPEGVGRFFKRTVRAAKTGVQTLQDRNAGADEGTGAVIEGPGARLPGAAVGPDAPRSEVGTTEASAYLAGKTAADIFGYSEQRREIAKRLKVNPYTENNVLAKRLDDVAWAAFSGGLGVAALKALAPASTLVTLAGSASNWVWDTPPGDLRVFNEQVLLGLGADQDSVDRFLRHPWYTLTLRTRLVKALDAMPEVAGRDRVMPLVLSVTTFDQARFVVESAEMLADLHKSVSPLDRLDVSGTLVGWAAANVIVPAPADALSWTTELHSFALLPELEVADRTIYLRGGATETAHSSLAQMGWSLRAWSPTTQ